MSNPFKRLAGMRCGLRPFVLALSASLVPLLAPVRAAALVWPDVAERIESDLGSTDPAVRRAALSSVRSLGRSRAAALELAALEDANDDVKLAAADAAIRMRVARATDVVVPWLSAVDPRLRAKACEVARLLPSPQAVVPLARTLGDQDPELRAAAATALGAQSAAGAVAPLLGRLDDPIPTVRVAVVDALDRLGDARATFPLVGKVEDSATEVRQAVVHALGDLGDRRSSSALILALRDSSTDVRRSAIEALGRMRAEGAVDAIVPFARDRALALRTAAMTALGRIATPEAMRALIGALGTGDDASGTLDATPARNALVAAGVTRSLPALQKLLDGSPSPQAATGAAWIIGALGARAGVPAIIASMRRGVLPTAAALRGLAGAGSEDDVPVLLEFIDDPNPGVRKEALTAALALLDPRKPDGRAV
ncbi:MAG: HEAT repeat domain-containing protein, partial [Polyangiaceae bacterium]